uniref:isopentenyl-diphosphate Delta-isomerase n=1 Tax=Haematococcus lacustris TaxID=44745 RepID=O81659_HAELA|nr:isopentenyl pyrophosphate:dimethylallyl pyrophosphate isomerase [Haematococcus lacustris]
MLRSLLRGLTHIPRVNSAQQPSCAHARLQFKLRSMQMTLMQPSISANLSRAEDRTDHMRGASTWAGGQSQDELMLKDECILVDVEDNITGHASKLECHKFLPHQPAGLLHRAFSVFLFDDQGRLLLQQRARSKITFPSVWTNTCCSHPLHGQTPDEVDQLSQVADGTVPGAKAAAIRKLEHELGIPAHQLPASAFRFLTRLHYCAADVQPAATQSALWGEHEMDYILFIRANVTLAPNPDEVDEVRYVTQEELRQMMQPDNGLQWSPWFRIIAARFLERWWADLDAALNTDKHEDWGTVHHINEA